MAIWLCGYVAMWLSFKVFEILEVLIFNRKIRFEDFQSFICVILNIFSFRIQFREVSTLQVSKLSFSKFRISHFKFPKFQHFKVPQFQNANFQTFKISNSHHQLSNSTVFLDFQFPNFKFYIPNCCNFPHFQIFKVFKISKLPNVKTSTSHISKNETHTFQTNQNF